MKKQIEKKAKDKQTEDFLLKLSKRCKSLRIERGFTSYEDFAYEKNLNRAQYGRYERGIKDLRCSSLAEIVVAFDMTFAEFFSEGFD